MSVVANLVLLTSVVYVTAYTIARLIIAGLDRAGLIYPNHRKD